MVVHLLVLIPYGRGTRCDSAVLVWMSSPNSSFDLISNTLVPEAKRKCTAPEKSSSSGMLFAMTSHAAMTGVLATC